jgi:peptidoglycan hydrolase-like protein with peptidoglycan-binding domain
MGFLVIVMTGMAGAFLAGSYIRSPQSAALDSINIPVQVTATVERRALASTLVVPGSMTPGTSVGIAASVPSGTERAVITSMLVAVGDTLQPGTIVATVSGRPLIVISTSVPLYRDLKDSDNGQDVSALQKWLQSMGYRPGLTGVFDKSTQESVSALYSDVDQQAPKSDDKKTMVRWREFVQIPGDEGSVTSIAASEAVLTDNLLVATAQTAPDVVVGRASITQAEALKVGQAVALEASGYNAQGVIQSIGVFDQGNAEKGTLPGMDIIASVPEDPNKPKPGQPVSINVKEPVQETLAVPLTAIKQDDTGTYVIVPSSKKDTDEGASVERIDVTVTGQRDGWAALAETSDLEPGTAVDVS